MVASSYHRNDRNVRKDHVGSDRYEREFDPDNRDQDHNDRVIPTIERGNERMGYAGAVRSKQNRDRGSRNEREEDQVPIHEKIALNRRLSRRNMNPQENVTQNNHPREAERNQRHRDNNHDP